ncbi:hypothetical protein AAG570_004618 [Ranatra chinensis]|uniref:Uncharacterized protein n=1 Tax=Ranatra chinensis TaxID=642074 RepID=A0ABD0Y1D2_9HEMI
MRQTLTCNVCNTLTFDYAGIGSYAVFFRCGRFDFETNPRIGSMINTCPCFDILVGATEGGYSSHGAGARVYRAKREDVQISVQRSHAADSRAGSVREEKKMPDIALESTVKNRLRGLRTPCRKRKRKAPNKSLVSVPLE